MRLGLLIGFLLAGLTVLRMGTAVEPPGWELQGTTLQGSSVLLRVDHEGRVQTFDFDAIRGWCDHGGTEYVGWAPADNGAPARFTSRGPVVEAEEVSHRRRPELESHITLRMRGRLTGDSARGTVRWVARYGSPPGRPIFCEAGPLSWTAERVG